MAEPFGIAAGAVGIAAAFTACVDCFDYVQHGRHFGRDYQTELISLDCARLRLTRWGEAVNIHDDPKLGRPDASPSEVHTVQNALHQVLVLFADTEKISKTYSLEMKTGDDLTVLVPNDLDPTVFGLRNKMKELALRRQKGASVLKTSSWALYHRSQLKELVNGITSLVDSIEKIFPAPEKKLALVQQEMAAIRDKQALELVESAAYGVDNLLLDAAKEALTGHQYLNVTIKGKAEEEEEKESADERPARERKTSVDYFNQSDQKKCLKVFQDADIEKSGAVSMFEIQAINTDLMPFQPKTIDRLVRLFADDDPTRVRYPSLNFDQFFAMWTCIREWKLDFEWGNWDKDVSVSRSHLLLVLKSRYHLDSKVLDTMYKAFHLDERLHLEDFVNICISLKRITDNFKHWNEGVSRNASRSIEQYSADVLLFHYEMSLGEAVYKRPAAIEKSEIVEDPGSASVTGNTPPLAPLPTVLEVNSSAEATPQLKNLIQQTNSGASETQVLGHSISSEQDLSLKNWKSFLPRLPDEFRDQLELREVFGSGLVWTCTPSDNIRTESIPLTIAGRPVVIPVEYLYPLMPATPPPPDPHPRFIDPSIAIDEATVNDIFNTFQDALGFYILINGMLQLIVSDGFDFQYAVSHRPNNFGGLKVSYISQDMIPTAAMPAESSNSTVTVQPASPVQSHQHARTMASSSTNFSQRTNQDDNLTKLELGSLIQAKVEKSKATERFQGKIGVMTISNDGYFLVVSSHVLTQALTAAKHDAFPGTDWVNKVTIISGNGGKEIGRVSETFDPQARAFPHGFLHDVSLVDVTYAPMHLVSGIKSPLPTEWLSQAGWSNIKYTTQTLYLLDSPNIQSKSIGILGSQCQMVGQGIFRLHSQLEKKTRFKFSFGNKRFNSTSASSTPETWTSLVSRSMLYRVDPDYRSPGAQSGTAVCVHEESEDKVEVVKIAGFSSYAQQVSDVQRFDMEGKKFYNRLEEGRVAFYGALQTPEKLREEHTIAS